MGRINNLSAARSRAVLACQCLLLALAVLAGMRLVEDDWQDSSDAGDVYTIDWCGGGPRWELVPKLSFSRRTRIRVRNAVSRARERLQI